MKKLFSLSLTSLLVLAPACGNRHKCKDNAHKTEEQTKTKSTLIFRDSDDRKSGPIQAGINFSDEDLK